MARLQIDHLVKYYGSTVAVNDVSLDIRDGEFVVLLGPSGCGKTTTLRMIAGFVTPTSGQVRLGERDVTAVPPWRRNTGMVFQSYALFPHLTVGENVAFGLEMRGIDKSETQTRVAEALQMVRLSGLADRQPRQLSGGQQQRVALARALVTRPDVLLLDEPLSNLDAKLREAVRVEIRQLQRQLGITTVMVTHDQEEALIMADRMVVMSEGSVRQVGTQRALYEQPADRFVAGFVGRTNLLSGSFVAPGRFRTEGGLTIACAGGAAGSAVIAVRPERVVLGPQAVGFDNRLPGTVEFVSYLGASIDVHVRVSQAERIVVSQPNRLDGVIPKEGDRTEVCWQSAAAVVLS
jgi:putative spermidine/putrescine transport system ATP-binding protein